MYHDCTGDATAFERNNVLYHYPINGDRLVIGKFCSIASGARFLFNSANHAMDSLSTYPFPFSLRNGACPAKILPAHGLTRAISPSATTYGSATKPLCWRAFPLATARSSAHGPW